jgi:hypothetical protein
MVSITEIKKCGFKPTNYTDGLRYEKNIKDGKVFITLLNQEIGWISIKKHEVMTDFLPVRITEVFNGTPPNGDALKLILRWTGIA